jgi:hypothetical protein
LKFIAVVIFCTFVWLFFRKKFHTPE